MGIYSNCGSPIWTAEGWLVITWCRSYETLLHRCVPIYDPSKEIGRLKELLSPREETGGYVPNVVYSCGAIIHNNSLILPMPYPTIPRLWVVDMLN
jgi:predicted GH43/DUF377 family glycosyl hydrolase